MNLEYKYCFFKAMANRNRLSILGLLKKGPLSVGEISSELEIEQSLTSHNLRQMIAWGFLRCETDGKRRLYSIDEVKTLPFLAVLEQNLPEYSNLCTCVILKGNDTCKHMEEDDEKKDNQD